MHAKGASHKCATCIQTDENHHKRHRIITELVVEYREATGNNKTSLAADIERLRVQRDQAQPQPAPFHHFHDFAAAEEDDDDDDVARNAEPERHNDNDMNDADNALEAVRTASTADTSDSKTPGKQSKAEIRAAKKAAKAEKSQAKAAKNQAKQSVTVRSEDIEAVTRVLHGDNAAEAAATHPLASDKTVEDVINRNKSFVSSIEAHKKQLLSSIARKRKAEKTERERSNGNGKGKKKANISGESDEKEAEMDDLVAAVLTNLGADPAHIRATGSGAGSKKEKGGKEDGSGAEILRIVASLKKEIREDLKTFEHEQRETCIRAGGFWRYVGSKVFERMTLIAQELDWKTGQKLKE
ncbi:hypothetical protein LTR61_001739 [Exophiala xenobiotica]|nr:hypothetical protein LTR61_001739 [Exophiala xenobiotica]